MDQDRQLEVRLRSELEAILELEEIDQDEILSSLETVKERHDDLQVKLQRKGKETSPKFEEAKRAMESLERALAIVSKLEQLSCSLPATGIAGVKHDERPFSDGADNEKQRTSPVQQQTPLRPQSTPGDSPQRFLSVLAFGQGSNELMMRCLHPTEEWSKIQRLPVDHERLDVGVTDSKGDRATMQVFHAAAENVESIANSSVHGLLACFNPADMTSLDEVEAALRNVTRRPNTPISTIVLAGISLRGVIPAVHSKAQQLADEIGFVYIPNVLPSELEATQLFNILRNLGTNLVSVEQQPPPYEPSSSASGKHDTVSRCLFVDSAPKPDIKPQPSAPTLPSPRIPLSAASPPYSQQAGINLDGSVDLTDRWAWWWARHWPQCSVKSIVLLREWTFALKTRGGPTGIHCIIDGIPYTDNVTVEVAIALLDSAEAELKSEKRMTLTAEQNFNSFRHALMLKDYSTAYDRIHAASTETALSFNFWRCATLVEQSCEQVASVRGKRIFLQVGETGAGKSSLMHVWKSSRFVKGANGGPVPDPECPTARSLENIRVSTTTTSETSTTAAVQLKLKDIEDPNDRLPRAGEIFVVDCPGYFDTRGPEFAVANEISIVYTAQQAESVTIVFVHSQRNTGSRLERVPLVIAEVSRLVPSLAEHLGAVRWIWNGFQDQDMQLGGFVPNMVADMIDKPTEACENATVMSLLEVLNKQMNPKRPSEANPEGARGVDLSKFIDHDPRDLDEIRAELLAYVLGEGQTRAKEPIRCPKTAFQFEASSATTIAIKEQIAIFSGLIQSQLESLPSQNAVDVIVFVLGELEQAATRIPLSMIGSGFDTCLRLVDQHLQKLCDLSISEFDRICQQNEVMQRPALEEFKLTLQNMKQAEQALARFHNRETAYGTTQVLEQTLSRGANSVWKRIERELKEDRVDSRDLSKLCMLASIFEEDCAILLQRTRSLIETKAHDEVLPEIDSILMNVASGKFVLPESVAEMYPKRSSDVGLESTSDVQSSDGSVFDGSMNEHEMPLGRNPVHGLDDTVVLADKLCEQVDCLIDLGAALTGIEDPDSNGASTEGRDPSSRPTGALVGKCRETLERQLEGIETKTIQTIESALNLAESEIKRCCGRVEFLRALHARTAPFSQLGMDTHIFFDRVLRRIDMIVDGAKADVDAVYKQSKADGRGFAPMEEKMAMLKNICRSLGPAVLRHTAERWVTLVSGLVRYLNETKRDLEADVDKFLHGNEVDTERLSHSWNLLQNATWIDLYSPGTLQEVVGAAANRIVKALITNADTIKRGGGADAHSENSRRQLVEAMCMVDQLHQIETLEVGIDGLEDLRSEFSEWFAEKLRVGLGAVYALFSGDFETLKTQQVLLTKYRTAVAKYSKQAHAAAEQILSECDLGGPFSNENHLEKVISAAEMEARHFNDELCRLQQRLQNATEEYASLKKIQDGYYSLVEDGKPFKALQKYLKENGFKCGGLEKLDADVAAKLEEVKNATNVVRTQTERVREQEGTLTRLREVLSKYRSAKQSIDTGAERSAHSDLAEWAAAAGLPEALHSESGLDQSVQVLSVRCSQALERGNVTVNERQSQSDFDFATANEVKLYLEVCSTLSVPESVDPTFLKTLREAQNAWEGAVKTQYETLMRMLTNGIQNADKFGPDCDSAEVVAEQIRQSLMKIEHIDQQYPNVFDFFEKLHMGNTRLQYYINEQLKGLHTRLQAKLMKLVNVDFGNLLVQVELAQALSAACDGRFERFEPKPMATAHGTHGTFYELFMNNHAVATEHYNTKTQSDLIKELFPDNREQDDSQIFHKLSEYHSARGPGPKATYRKLMRYYTNSLTAQMCTLKTQLMQLERVVDEETVKFFPKLEQFLNRLSGGIGGVLLMFQPLWEADAAASPSGTAKGTFGTQIEEWIDHVRKLLAEKMKGWLINIQKLAKSKDFQSADARFAAVHRALLVLQTHATQLEVDYNGGKITIKKLQAETEAFLSVQLEAAVKTYDTLELKDYSMYPPSELITKLEKAKANNDSIHTVMETLEEKIREKFRNSIKKAREECNPESTELVDAERALKSLPERMRNQLEPMVTDAAAYISKESEMATKYAEDVLVNVKGNVDVKTLHKWCTDSRGKPQHDAARKLVQDELTRRARKCIDDVVVGIDSHKPEEFLAGVNALSSWTVLDEHFSPGFSDIHSHVSALITDAVSTWMCQLQSMLDDLTNALVGGIGTGLRGPNFHTIFRAVAELLDNRKALGDAVGPRVSPKLEAQFDKCEDTLIELSKKLKQAFETALEQIDNDMIKNLITLVSQFDTEVPTKRIPVRLVDTVTMYRRARGTRDEGLETAAECFQLGTVELRLRKWVESHGTILQNSELLNEHTVGKTSTKKTRAEYFLHLNRSTRVMLIVVPELAFLSLSEREKFISDGQTAVKRLKGKVADLYLNALARSKKENSSTLEELIELGEWMDVLVSIEESITTAEDITRGQDGSMINHLKERLKQMVYFKMKRAIQSLQQENNFDEAAAMLVQVKMVGEGVRSLREVVSTEIDNGLRLVRADKGNGMYSIQTLHRFFETRGDPIAALVLDQHPAFRGGQILRFNRRCQDISYVLDNLTCSTKDAQDASFDRKSLKEAYDEVMLEWNRVVNLGLRPNTTVDVRCAEALRNIQTLRQDIGNLTVHGKFKQLMWQRSTIQKIPKMLANFFALWTLSTADHYFDAQDSAERDMLMAPHPGQVVALLRMFGIGYADRPTGVLLNNLVQLKTGEGKSVTMAMAAMVLASLGCHVSCACYSSTLSERDREAFATLFQLVNVDNSIVYGTFDRLCEAVINKDGEVRSMVQKLIQGTSTESGAVTARSARKAELHPVLIVDEVDVFFSQAYYGRSYDPATILRHEIVKKLVLKIWNERKNRITSKDIMETTEYKECLAHFGEWSQLVIEAVGDMLVDVNRFASVPYVVKQNQIGYKEHDNIVFNHQYRYCTMFAYCHEHDAGNITEQSRDRFIGISVRCGSFSYAEIPAYFHCIMGVTGTLDSLSSQPRKIIHSVPFSIVHQTYVPTVFGGKPPRFRPGHDVTYDLLITAQDRFHSSLAEQLEQRRYMDGNKAQPRAVLVFFDSHDKLKAAIASPQMVDIHDQVEVLTEDLDDIAKTDKIKRASYANSVTFCTAIFGRGTDFICRDSRVLSNGGVHVIQTYVAPSLADEVQVNGRSARQGQPGSYSMLLVREELEQYGIDLAQLDKTPYMPRDGVVQNSNLTYSRQAASGEFGQKFQYISDCRNQTFDLKYAEETAHIGQLKDTHTKSFEFLEKLRNPENKYAQDVKKFLLKHNLGARADVKSRTICLMDATGSMGSLLQKAKHTVSIVYARLFDLLSDHGIAPGLFEVQFVCYRNYNSTKEDILQASPFSSRPDDLSAFMDSITPKGGCGEEAVEAGLWHVNQEISRCAVSQVLLIGDAPANSKDDVRIKRGMLGEEYWAADDRFGKPTTVDAQLEAIVNAKVPIHAYWVSKEDGREKAFFEKVAAATGGQSGFLDVNSEQGKVDLTNLLSIRILASLDGKSGKLVNAYKKKYGVRT